MRESSDGMREILFRGKNIVTGKWVYGYLVEGTDSIYNTPITLIFPVDVPLYSYGGYLTIGSEPVIEGNNIYFEDNDLEEC